MVDPDKDWIKLHRNLLVNELWRSEPFTKGQAWVDLLMLANHTDGYFFNRGIKVDVSRGQVGMSELQLSLRWKWSRTKVRSFFSLLEKEQQIIQHKNNVNSLITIVNYDTYQSKRQEKEQQEDTRKTPEEQQKDTNKNEKKEKKEKIEEPVVDITGGGGAVELFPICKAWHAFKAMRKSIKKPLTPFAEGLIVKKLVEFESKGHDPTTVLHNSIENSWQGVFEPKEKTNGRGLSGNAGQNGKTGRGGIIEANPPETDWL